MPRMAENLRSLGRIRHEVGFYLEVTSTKIHAPSEDLILQEPEMFWNNFLQESAQTI